MQQYYFVKCVIYITTLFLLPKNVFTQALSFQKNERVENKFISFPFVTENLDSIIKKNKISEERHYSYTIKKGRIKDSTLFQTIRYNNNGKIEQSNYYKGGKHNQQLSLYYNKLNQLEKIVLEKFIKPTYTTLYEIEYNDIGKEIMRYISNRDTSDIIQIKSTYDSNNQLKAIYKKINSSDFALTHIYTYDSLKRMLQIDYIDESTNNVYCNKKQYDSILIHNFKYEISETDTVMFSETILNFQHQILKQINYPGNRVMLKKMGMDESISVETNNDKKPNFVLFNYNVDGTLFEIDFFKEEKIYRKTRYYYTYY